MSQLVEDLRATAGIVQKGWCQGALARDDEGQITTNLKGTSHCIVGALSLSTRNEYSPRYADLVIAVGGALKCPNGLADWNDQPERTQEEVVSFLLGLADQYEKEEIQ